MSATILYKMMKSYAHLEQKVYSDGKMVEDKDIVMNYDGEKMSVDVRENGHKKHMVINKDDIMKVFTQPMHSNNLMARLKLDFKPNKKKRTHKNDKTNKKKKQRKTAKKRSS